MFRYKIVLLSPEGEDEKIEWVYKYTFAEAAMEAYKAKNKLGLDWKIHSVARMKK